MDSSGIFLIQGSDTTIVKGQSAQLTLAGGPVLYSPDITPGLTPANPAECMRRMSAEGAVFVKAPQ